MNDPQQNTDLATISVLPANMPVVMPELPPQLTITTAQQFKAVSDPIRSRILGIIQNQPATAKQIADRLGATPGAIGHHLHVLESAGLAKVVALRIMRGIVSNYYTRTARIFTYHFPDEITGGAPKGLAIMTSARDELAESLQTIKEGPLLMDGFPHIRLSPKHAQTYSELLNGLLDDILRDPPDPDGAVYGIFLAMFKAPAYMQGPDTSVPPESSTIQDGENQ